MSGVAEQILEMISAKAGKEVENLTLETPIQESGINSLTFVEIVVEIEDILGIEVDDDALAVVNYKTLGDFINAVEAMA